MTFLSCEKYNDKDKYKDKYKDKDFLTNVSQVMIKYNLAHIDSIIANRSRLAAVSTEPAFPQYTHWGESSPEKYGGA